MVSVLDSGSSGPGSGPAGDIVLCSWARRFTLTVLRNAGGNPAMD